MPDNESTNHSLAITSDDDSQYLVNSQTEIIFILRDLIEKRSMFTAYFNTGKSFILTSILTVLPDRGAFVFDFGSNDAMNEQLLKNEKLIFVTSINGVKIQFVTGKAREVQFKGRDAFITNLPKELLRLQRREYYRIEIPGFARIGCDIPELQNDSTIVLNVRDISLGGLSIVTNKQIDSSSVMETFHNCRLDLKSAGNITVDLEVRIVIALSQNKSGLATRLGCKFVKIAPAHQAILQRFMAMVEKEEHALFSK